MIRIANAGDIDSVMRIVRETIEIMRAESNPQWDDVYPARSDFVADMESGSLFVYEDAVADVLGVICANLSEPDEYAALSWAQGSAATVVHRMAVLPQSRGKGVGRAMLEFAADIARMNGTNYLKSDTYGINAKMNALFLRNGFTLRGDMYFKGKPDKFNCYDKVLE